VPGAVVQAFVMLVMAETCCIVAEACEKYQAFDIGKLVRLIPGPLGSVTECLCNLVIWVGMFMCLVGYMIVSVDIVLPMVSSGPLDSRVVLIMISTACCLPLCYVNQQYLAFSSFLAIAVNIYLVLLVAYQFLVSPWTGEPSCTFGYGKGIVSLYSTIMMAVVMQMCTPPMYKTLEHRSVARFRKVVYTSYSFLFLLFTGFQTVALYAFGPLVPQDILVSLPGNVAGNAARLGMLGVILGVYPIMMIPMVAPILDAEWGGKSMASFTKAGIAVSGMVVAFFVTQLGVLNVINGSFTVVIIVTLAPGLVGLYLVEKNKIMMRLLIAMGAVTSILGFLLPENYVGDVQRACFWK